MRVAVTRRAGRPAAGGMTVIRGGAVTLAEAADAFLSSPWVASANTRRAYAAVIDRLIAELGTADRLTFRVVPIDILVSVNRMIWRVQI